ncbi:MAG: 16S rRNA (cytidine(1402)-2'-O)-methyltransferase [Clostridiales bacterium]|nr:16S rRNA (cytidine(1402)-2'-O)-methyltransferase [Clostridiales bacterium]
MGDISSRAVEILSSVDYIACEDTRVTGILLKNLGIEEHKLISYHEHNKASKGQELVDLLKQGFNVAQVSDAGMPAISDPGEDLVKLCIEQDVEFTVVPGPVAAITALVLSGISTRRYHYEGFLPNSGSERRKRLKELPKYDETIVLYEAPHRLRKLVSELKEEGFGPSRAAFCRELTKKYEEVLRMTIDEAEAYYEQTEPRGEYVVCLEPAVKAAPVFDDEYIDSEIRRLREEGMSVKEIAKVLSDATGFNKKEMYSRAVSLLKS